MSTLQKVLLALAFSLTFLGFVLVSNRGVGFGSVESASAGYVSTSTVALTGALVGTALPSGSVVCRGQGILGSVVITGANTGVVNFYDGTTTTAHSDYPTTTIASLPASLAAGTYTFDAAFNRGLLVEITGSVATGTITCKK